MPPKYKTRRRCVYCGKSSWGSACAEHGDLIELDPAYFTGFSRRERREANAARRATGGASA